jgi:alpha-L-fucosidase
MSIHGLNAQTMDEMWDSRTSGQEHHNIQWFKDAKFGMFIHWGLYSKLGGEWNGKRYYGSGEWIMSQARIPVAQYKEVASTFNPVKFDGAEWAQLAEDAGIKYMVITAKHHEGFSMFDSKVTKFDIVDATPYKKDPMKSLAKETKKRNIHFGFYYSQFQDWYEPNGGRNSWDFKEAEKDYQKYYKEKAIPQLKELMSNYGKLGILWFDTPGGMTKEQTKDFVDDLRQYQKDCLFSSRVGHGLGDYRDYGDSEMPAKPIKGAWESIYTHNDSWGYIKHDMNFKTSTEIIRLLTEAAAKGGNLMLNVGPDGEGNIPPYTAQFLRETGAWLKKNGESIYGTTTGLIAQQPWGFSTTKPGKQYLHVLNQPSNGEVFVPLFTAKVAKIYALNGNQALSFKKDGNGLRIQLSSNTEKSNFVIVVDYEGTLDTKLLPLTVSSQFASNNLEVSNAELKGNTKVRSFTYSHYYGDWKHTTCGYGQINKTDELSYNIYIDQPGDYELVLDYNCGEESARQEGVLKFNGEDYFFRTLKTGEFDRRTPMLFIDHAVATVTVKEKGNYKIVVHPYIDGSKELFKLRGINIKPVK